MNLKYGSKVKVTSGFYEGMEGILQSIVKEAVLKTDINVYALIIQSVPEEVIVGNKIVIIPESSLELIK